MAKTSSNGKRKGAQRQAASVRRRFVVRDANALAPVFADFAQVSTGTVGNDICLHTVFRTEIPPTIDQEVTEIDTIPVARYLYTGDHFKELVALFVRQYLRFAAARGRRGEAAAWLGTLLAADSEKEASAVATSDEEISE